MQKRRSQCDRAPGGIAGRSPSFPAACFSTERIVQPLRPLLDRGLLDETIDHALVDSRIERALHQVRQLVRAVRQLPHPGGVAPKALTLSLAGPLQKLQAARQAVVDLQLTLLGVAVGEPRRVLRSTSGIRRDHSSGHR